MFSRELEKLPIREHFLSRIIPDIGYILIQFCPRTGFSRISFVYILGRIQFGMVRL